ncbi:MAG: histidine kinase [Gemmatimonadota bacterium]
MNLTPLHVVVGVTLAWVLLGVVLGSQTALGMNMQGNPVVVGDAIRTAWVNNLPWIPATLVAIAMARRFPLRRATWRRVVWLHLLAVPAVSWIANVGVVLGFWLMSGNVQGIGVLAEQAAFWGTVRLHVALLVYALAVAVTHAWITFRSARDRELRLARLESQLTRARLEALNAQIRPHFLFNTLHTIGQLWRSGRDDVAEDMLDRLGSLFQQVRRTTESTGITLDEELTMVEDYLAIEQARFADRLRTEIDVSHEARLCVVPPLILQPIVENAIRHGTAAIPGEGRVRVEGVVEQGELRVTVSDNGPGMSAPTAHPGSGTGLSNTRERLIHAFGDDAELDVGSVAESGTRVTIRVPAQVDEPTPGARA